MQRKRYFLVHRESLAHKENSCWLFINILRLNFCYRFTVKITCMEKQKKLLFLHLHRLEIKSSNLNIQQFINYNKLEREMSDFKFSVFEN